MAGLLLRDAYRDASLGRLLATIGAIAVLVPWFVPEHGKLPIAAMFDMISDGKGGQKARAVTLLLYPLLALASFLVWIPAPSSAGGKILAWLLILTPMLIQYSVLIATGHIGDVVKAGPNEALLSGGGGGGELPFPISLVTTAFVGYVGYGLATLLGKNLEK